MDPAIRLDCVGMRCPRPIIEIAKASRKCPPGTVLSVRADDLAFESDVTAWAETASATILELTRQGKEVTVQIRLPG